MAKILGADVMDFLRPNGGWIMVGDHYEGIQFIDCESVSEAEFNAGFTQVEAAKAQAEAEAITKRAAAQAKLAALGLTSDDLKALGLG